MAVFYKWLKGCAPGSSLESGQWSYLEWGSATDNNNNKVVSRMPRLYIAKGRQDELTEGTYWDAGYLLSNEMPRPYLMGDWNFSNSIIVIGDNYKSNINELSGTTRFNPDSANYGQVAYGELSTEYGGTYPNESYRTVLRAKNPGNETGNFVLDSVTAGLCGSVSDDVRNSVIYVERWGDITQSCTDVLGRMWIQRKLQIASEMTPETIGADKTFAQDEVTLNTRGRHYIGINPYDTTDCVMSIPYWVNGSKEQSSTNTHTSINTALELRFWCSATYFNARSDKRAKENIALATYNALELIKKLPVYTFNYKKDKEKVTGILAQDLLEVQPEGLDLVSNINATGENDDYMSIKNDKLMFVLMKAIQEQQEQIEALKAEIEKLKA